MTTVRTISRAFGFMVVAFLSCGALARAVEPAVRILPLGDSITMGQAEPGEQGGYRDLLYSLLTTAGYNVDFVGTQEDSNNPDLPDTDHEGHPGYQVNDINLQVGSWLNTVSDPDVILLHIGTNDILQGRTPTATLANLDTLIANLATTRPFAKIIVSTLILSTYSAGVEADLVTYNQGIPGIVAQHVSKGRQVTLVDMHPVLGASDLYDTVHPTTAGYDKMANAWLPAIASVISPLGTSNPPVIAGVETFDDNTRLKVTFSKPVADSSANVANFGISGGVTISNAVLDSSKRTVTLTTSLQPSGASYTLTISGVLDRTAAQTPIAPESKAIYHQSVINNGSFESHYTGWPTHTGHISLKDTFFDPPYAASNGRKLLAFNTSDQTPNGVLSRSFTTVPGTSYYLYFDLGGVNWNGSLRKQRINVNVQGVATLLDVISEISVPDGGVATWYPWGYYFTADSTSTSLTFTDVSDPSKSYSADMLLDNVQVTTPQPITLAVTSTPMRGPTVTISPNDLSGNGSGPTGLIRSYNAGTSVTLTAPATAGGRNFVRWQVNGQDLSSTNRTITHTLNINSSLNAVYDPSGGPYPPEAVAESYTTPIDTALAVAAPGVLANDVDGDNGSLTAVLDSGPTHGVLTLDPDGSFIYTPAVGYHGSDSFSYHAYNGATASNVVTVSLLVNAPPVAVDDGSVNSPFLTVNEDSSQSSSMFVLANDNDPDGHFIFITAASSPNGMVSITNFNTRLRFTPTSDFSGPTTISYSISDGHGGTANATVHVMVNPANDAPVAIEQTLSTNEDVPLPITLTGSDIDGDPLNAFNVTVAPQHGTLSGTPPILTYTPDENYHGPDSVSFTVSDGVAVSEPATVWLTVNPVDDTPVALAQSVSLDEDGMLAITLTGTDVETASLTFANGEASHGTLTGTAPNLTYTPDPNYHGTDSFTFTVNDGSLTSAPATISITVNPINDAPAAVADSYATDEDIQLAVVAPGVLGNDTDLEGPLNAVLVNDVTHGALALNANGSFTYDPAANFHGEDSFTYKVSDGSLESNSVTVSLTVNPVDDTPVALAQSLSLDEDGTLAITLTGTDAETASLTFADGEASHGTLTGTAPNLTYTPAPNFHGADSFTFTVNDGSLTSAPATISITVDPVNDAPVADPQALSTNEDTALPVTLTGSDIDGDPITGFTTTSAPQHGSLTGTPPNLTYTPASNYHGPDQFSFTVSDGQLTSAEAVVSITVEPVNDEPVADAQSLSTDEETALPVTLTGSDIDGDPITGFTVTIAPQHGALTGSPPNLTYTPDTNYHGPDQFRFTVSDGQLTSAEAVVSITVDPVNDAPVADTQSLGTDEDTALPVTLTGSDIDGDPITGFTVTIAPQHGTLTGTPPNLTYTPSANYHGPDGFSFTVSDGQLTSAEAVISIMVDPVNDAPVADAQVLSTDEDTALPVTLTGSDIDGDTLTEFAITIAPQHGALTGTPPNLTYTPSANYHGPDQFSFTVSDGQLTSAEAVVSITVDPVNDAPVATDDSHLTDEDDELIVSAPGVLANDADVDGPSLTAQLVTNVMHGTLSFAPDGGFSYMPDADFSGEDSFTYLAHDGSLDSNTVTVTITIEEVGGNPMTEWLTSHGLTDGPGVDSDQDSICNAIEYVVGGNPNDPSDANLQPIVTNLVADPDNDSIASAYLRFSYRRTDKAKNDAFTTIVTEWTSDLAEPWTTADGSHGEVTVVEDDMAGPATDWVHVYIPQGAESRIFARLKVVVVPQP